MHVVPAANNQRPAVQPDNNRPGGVALGAIDVGLDLAVADLLVDERLLDPLPLGSPAERPPVNPIAPAAAPREPACEWSLLFMPVCSLVVPIHGDRTSCHRHVSFFLNRKN